MADHKSPASEIVREVTPYSWLVGERILISRQAAGDDQRPSWSDGEGSYFVLSDVLEPPPSSRLLSSTSPIQKVHDAGGVAAAWKIGDAFLKVRDLEPTEMGATREHVTLLHLRDRGEWSFAIPDVLYHALWGNRYILLITAIPGQTLGDEWPRMDEASKEYYVNRIVGICEELESYTADYIGGVDGHHLADHYLNKHGARSDFTSEYLISNCRELGMSASRFRFYHCDLGPGNIIVNRTDGTIGIIDWETAGFVSRAWIRTKFRVSSGLDLPSPSSEQDGHEWRRRVQQRLGDKGFPDVAVEWMPWWSNS